ncbi:hypothetical protein [Halosimplex pelagicum]|uniref:Methanogenesis regulatory protein FilR1 middle domain-containing protein n=1 Tax=Halosimplex pelagicum TaxID=869886 RepID=A0A7D5TA14_9EURY|nr:hypothetical protein [Halosimplex pelagicum]QLH80933.1 hypothetical protein HZS54_04455 [Halosimplex pelagicum]
MPGESDVKAVLNQLNSLTQSRVKFQILLDAADGLDADAVTERYPGVPYTNRSKKDELKKEGLVREDGGEITLTQRGRHIERSLRTLFDDFLIDNRVRPFFQSIECDGEYIPDITNFTQDATIHRESDDLDLTVKNRYKGCLRESETLRELLPFPLGLRQPTEAELVTDDAFDAEYVLSDDFFSDITNNAHYQQRMYDYSSDGNVSWHVASELPYMLSVFDDRVLFITQNGRLKIALESADEDIVDWAREQYRTIRGAADELDLASENGGVRIERTE